MKPVPLITCLILLFGCGHNKPAKNDPAKPLYDEVMKIHDDVMPKMSDINRYQKQLRKQLDTESDSTKKVILNAINNLEMADEGMMQWMADFKVPDEEPAKTTYLKDQKKHIEKVRDDMLNSMEQAKILLDEK